VKCTPTRSGLLTLVCVCYKYSPLEHREFLLENDLEVVLAVQRLRNIPMRQARTPCEPEQLKIDEISFPYM